MCGLVGFATKDKTPYMSDRRGFLHQGLMDSMWRGMEATGISLTKHGKEKTQPEVYKSAICAFDFCRRPYFEHILSNIDEFSLVLGHTRSATRGVSHKDANAHPFQHNHITLTHNGTIDDQQRFLDWHLRPQEMSVDSHAVAFAMGNLKDNEDESKVLEQLTGAYALVWHNARDGSLNFARNDKKPLFFCWAEKQDTLFWASEYSLLVHLLERRNCKIEERVWFPEPHDWLKFDLSKTREYDIRPFVPRPLPATRDSQLGPTRMRQGGHSTGIDGVGPDGTFEYPEPTADELKEIRRRMASGENLDLSDDGSIREFLQSHKSDPDIEHSGMPTSPKKVRAAAQKLKDLQIDFNQSFMLGQPLSFTPYTKNRGKVGQVEGRSAHQKLAGIPLILNNVRADKWELYKEYGKVWVIAVNIRKMPNNKKAVVCREHPRHQARMLDDLRLKAQQKESSKSLQLVYMGPGNHLVTVDKFLELSKDGCGNCSGHINPIYHEEIQWIGEPPTPICVDCSEDPEFWTGINDLDAAKKLQHAVH